MRKTSAQLSRAHQDLFYFMAPRSLCGIERNEPCQTRFDVVGRADALARLNGRRTPFLGQAPLQGAVGPLPFRLEEGSKCGALTRGHHAE